MLHATNITFSYQVVDSVSLGVILLSRVACPPHFILSPDQMMGPNLITACFPNGYFLTYYECSSGSLCFRELLVGGARIFFFFFVVEERVLAGRVFLTNRVWW